jgi:DnaJ-class molecular chaperone
MSLKLLIELLEEHRKQAVVTCDVNCFCWPVQGFIDGQTRDAQQRNEASGGTCPSCAGKGIYIVGMYHEKCNACNGSGHV